jgi:hypothetical protein
MSKVATNHFASNPDQVLSGTPGAIPPSASTSSTVQSFHLGQVEPGDFVTMPMIHPGEAQRTADQVNNKLI